MPLSDRKQADPLSKSQLKRDMLALQKLGELLVDLPATQLAKIPLPEELAQAIHFARSLKAKEAKRRQMQYIGKLMRLIDPVPIQAALDALKHEIQKDLAQFHKMETWRDQLLAEGDEALQQFLGLYPNADRQQIRQLIRNAQQDHLKNKNTGAARELFNYLRKLIKPE